MTYRLITCPESAHLEMVELVDDPLGLLVSGCSRFRPPSALACPRTCAARLDRGARCVRAEPPALPPSPEPEVGDDTDAIDLERDVTFPDALEAVPLGW